MVPWLEQAGYGLVVYDYAFNRKLEESSAAFARDWAAFRQNAGERQPWIIVAHSMGCLLARALVERDATWNQDVSSLALIAPVNQGSEIAKVQTMQQLLSGVQKVNGKNAAQAMLHLSDGLGQAAQDMLPGSAFLTRLNRLPRRPEVAYHIMAGDRGVLNAYARSQIEARLTAVTRSAGVLGALTKAATADFPDILDELTDDTGDGCVAVERTRLAGVGDWSVMHANHAELIRAPLLFSEPGPVACMPTLLRWLEQDRERAAK
jgi:pimeloyl-ACP methyl ester carboxylesterase